MHTVTTSTKKQVTPRLRLLRALGRSATGVSPEALADAHVRIDAVIAACADGLVFTATSARSTSTRWHLTRAGMVEAERLGLVVATDPRDYDVILFDGRVVHIAEARALAAEVQ